MACHTPSRVAPSDPRWRAATVGGFTFGGSDPPYSILAVQAEKDGITTISGELMGKSLSILHIVVTHSLPTPYSILFIWEIRGEIYSSLCWSGSEHVLGTRLGLLGRGVGVAARPRYRLREAHRDADNVGVLRVFPLGQ